AGSRARGRDAEAEIELALEDAYRGTRKVINLTATETCPDCRGAGIKDRQRCPTCRGTGLIRRPKSLQVNIPAGVRDGSVVRLAGQGDPGGDGMPPGDLYLRIRLKPHP